MKESLISSALDEVENEIEEFISKLTPIESRPDLIKKIIQDINAGKQLSDHAFDRIFPKKFARKSFPHWTPYAVVRRVIEMLNPDHVSQVLDVGSGCGKFCLIAGLLKTKGHFTGIEQRQHLVEIAQEIGIELNLKDIKFIHGDMSKHDWRSYDCFYLFNPFFEHLMNDQEYWIDQTISIEKEKYDFYVNSVEEKLKTLKSGTRVVTYHGFGGAFPPEYSLIISEEINGRYSGSSGFIELWIKTR